MYRRPNLAHQVLQAHQEQLRMEIKPVAHSRNWRESAKSWSTGVENHHNQGIESEAGQDRPNAVGRGREIGDDTRARDQIYFTKCMAENTQESIREA